MSLRNAVFMFCVFFALQPAALAFGQDARSALHIRTAAAGALMLNHDQRTWLQYQDPGVLADIQLAYRALPWLDVQVGATGGIFISRAPGGLLSPMLGVLGRLPLAWATPYASVDLGLGFTGSLVRPFARVAVGLEFEITPSLRLGPNLGLGIVTQHSGALYSNDGTYLFLGLGFSYWPVDAPPAARQSLAPSAPAPRPRFAPPLTAAEPSEEPRVLPPAPPSPELSALLDRALPTQQNELLAPVLFPFDSDALEPTGVAMLHEVARVLSTERADIELIEIVAYADARGESDYNHALAGRRAQRVLDWLVQHGIAAARLQIRAAGAVEFVENGNSEDEHAQNRRVVFRVVRVRQP